MQTRILIIGVAVLAALIGALVWGMVANRPLPQENVVDVPFTSQAPVGDWSEPWASACEETSIYMVTSFYADDEIARDEAVKRIREIFDTKSKEIQVSRDESLETIVELIKTLELSWTPEIVYDPTIDDLKEELAENRPIIVPVYAPLLNNPYYDGVEYHVLVLTGYDDEKGVFIVNDPGTQHGEALNFSYDVFLNAIHDLDHRNYEAGRKAVLFTSP
jgi:hypothetical protein